MPTCRIKEAEQEYLCFNFLPRRVPEIHSKHEPPPFIFNGRMHFSLTAHNLLQSQLSQPIATTHPRIPYIYRYIVTKLHLKTITLT